MFANFGKLNNALLNPKTSKNYQHFLAQKVWFKWRYLQEKQ